MSIDRLHPRVAEIVDALENAQREMMEVVMAIPSERRDAPGRDGAWSIAEHIEHLAIVEDGAGRLMSKLIKHVEASDERETDESSVLHSLDRFQVWTVTRKIEAPEFVKPSQGLSTADGIAKLTEARRRMTEALRRASGLALGSVSAPHPVVGPLTVYQWGLITAHHQRRHVEQIRTIAGMDD